MLLGWLGGEVVRVALEVSSGWEVSLRGTCWALGLQACCGVVFQGGCACLLCLGRPSGVHVALGVGRPGLDVGSGALLRSALLAALGMESAAACHSRVAGRKWGVGPFSGWVGSGAGWSRGCPWAPRGLRGGWPRSLKTQKKH